MGSTLVNPRTHAQKTTLKDFEMTYPDCVGVSAEVLGEGKTVVMELAEESKD